MTGIIGIMGTATCYHCKLRTLLEIDYLHFLAETHTHTQISAYTYVQYTEHPAANVLTTRTHACLKGGITDMIGTTQQNPIRSFRNSTAKSVI